MATAAPESINRPRPATLVHPHVNVALLGLGHIGRAVARAIAQEGAPLDGRLRIVGALVRDASRERDLTLPPGAAVTSEPSALFLRRPSIVIELLGGVEPAFTLVARALANGIAVVTANKSLIAAHGPELRALSARTGAPLRYEASVLAGVPFLGALARRPRASGFTRIEGIVNGTSNHILTAMHEQRTDLGAALRDAQARGLAEPDPRNDVSGLDAAEKVSVLLQHFGWCHARPDAIETTGIEQLLASDIEAAQRLGGVVKPVVFAERSADGVEAFVGPAFVPAGSRLASVNGAENALALRNGYGDLFYAGPGAGPAATAATVLDDVTEIAQLAGRATEVHEAAALPAPSAISAPETGWLLRLTSGSGVPAPETVADLLGSHGIWLRRTLPGHHAAWAITWSTSRARIERALSALASASGCEASAIRTLEN